MLLPGRTPHGVRGLKYTEDTTGTYTYESHPSRGAWIEIIARLYEEGGDGSHPSRGAWTEMVSGLVALLLHAVAPLTGCVD